MADLAARIPGSTDTGEVAEWSNVPDSKSGVRKRTEGSNPSLSSSGAYKGAIFFAMRLSGSLTEGMIHEG